MPDETDHPTYPNPTVVEAVCQVEFEPPPESGWEIGRPGPFLGLVTSEYPIIEPVPGAAGFAITIGQVRSIPQFAPQSSALKLSVDAKNRYIAIGDRHFAFGHSARYPGWDKFRKHLLEGWSKFVSVAKISQITRTSLRYVNVIPRTEQHPLVSDWLKATETIPETLIRTQLDPFLLRLESWIDRNSLLIVTAGTAAMSGQSTSAVLLDIQRTSTVVTKAAPDDLMHHIDSLHLDVWKEFSSVRTPRLKAHLEGRPI